MSRYKGMRWFKCDLQVQTPEDGRHWDLEDPLRLGSPRSEQDLQEKARQYLRRCHEVGLEVIGVTDHNFCGHRQPRERFLAHLIEQNGTVAQEVGREPLWIFPGFEVDIGYHVLCLFPPIKKSTELDQVCDLLTQLGLPPSGRFATDRPEDLRRDGRYVALSEILRIVQKEGSGIVIAAHAFADDGIAEKDGKHAGDYRNEDLLCIEVTKFPLGEREKAVLEANSGVWKRSRPPAYIMSSDAKSTLKDEDGKPKPNSLGYRATWIKMSEPSIEALRQAFLDFSSRIWLEADDPRIIRHQRIASLLVQDVAFLEDQEVFFSPHLNCLIGGRGSGKSSLFEYIRLAVRKEVETAAQAQIGRIKATLKTDSLLRLSWHEQDQPQGDVHLKDVFEFRLANARAQVVSRGVVDPATVFANLDVQIFSQGQITEIARRPSFLLPLIDSLVGPKLRSLKQTEAKVREMIEKLQQERRTLERLEAEQKALRQELEDLERRWQAQSSVQEEQRKHRAAQEAARYLDDLTSRTEAIAHELTRQAEDLTDSHAPLGSVVKNWPESTFFESLDWGVERAKQDLADEIRQALDRFNRRVKGLTVDSLEWQKVQGSIQAATDGFLTACAEQGLKPDEVDQILQVDLARKAKLLELERKRNEVAIVQKSALDYEPRLAELHDIWREQTELRRRRIQEILQGGAIPKVPEGRPSLEVQIDYSGDREHFFREWGELIPDARTRLGRIWEDLGIEAFSGFANSSLGSPWKVVEGWLGGKAPPILRQLDLMQAFREHLSRETWGRKTLVRIQDSIDLVLYREDGSPAGSLSKSQLSEGQRNTAVLSLLLASGTGPMLIDQPEDELDSNFISQQLVPLLREIKNQRQVILVTHNPNLPVNADAELVYALKARAVDGGPVRGVVEAQGGLDQDGVKSAVLDIMEGSEQAFRKRREKYNF